MIAEINYVQNWFKEKYPDSKVPDGVYAIPTSTSKGDAYLKIHMKDEASFGKDNFSLYWDEDLTISWYTNDKPKDKNDTTNI